MDIATKLRILRTQKNLSQRDVAEKLGIAQPTYARYENGKRTPKYETRQKIAAAIGVPISELLDTHSELEIKNERSLAIEKINSIKTNIQYLEQSKEHTNNIINSYITAKESVPAELTLAQDSVNRQLNERKEELLQLESKLAANDSIKDTFDKEWENLGIYYWALSAKRQNRLKEILQDMFNSEMYEKEQKKKNP